MKIRLFPPLLCGVLLLTALGTGCQTTPAPEPVSETDQLLEESGISTADAQALVDTLVDAALAGEREQVADLFAYPRALALPGQPVRDCTSAQDFLPDYDQIFTDALLARLEQHRDDALTSDGMAVRACDGAVWLMAVDGQPKIASVFADSDRYLAYYEGANGDTMYTVCGIQRAQAQDFFDALLDDLRADDRAAVADRIAYPRQLTAPDGTRTIDNADDLLAVYDQLFSADLLSRLEQTQTLSYNQYGVFAADGALWFSLHGDKLAIDAVAPDETHALRAQSSQITPTP